MKEPPGSDHWSHTVVPITLAAIALAILVKLFLDFLHADW